MLVVISDLHFVDETAGKHNLPVEAFSEVFLSSIITLAVDKGAKELKLLLLGDIPDLVRSEQWFMEEEIDRPWGANGLADLREPRPGSLTEQRCLNILGQLPNSGLREDVPKDTILYCNWDTFAFFRELPELINAYFTEQIPVELIFIPGNHDRLVNVYPSVRDALQKMMGLRVSEGNVVGDPAGTWWYRYDYLNEEYALYARHGHQFDPFNYAGSENYAGRSDNLAAPIGDVISTEFAVALPYTLRQIKDRHPCVDEDLIEALKDVDIIRPVSRILEWLYFRVRREDDPKIRQALDETVDIVVKQFLDLQFVQTWHSDETGWDTLFRWASKGPLGWLFNQILKFTNVVSLAGLFLPIIMRVADSDEAREQYVVGAFGEAMGRENPNVRYLVYGHTHTASVHPLDGAGGRELMYVNAGTWRNRIFRTIDLDREADFVALKQMTYAVFYRADEDAGSKQEGTVSFDIWTGNKQKYYK